MEQLRASRKGSVMAGGDVLDREAHLRAACRFPLAFVQCKMQEGAVGPRRRDVRSAYPAVLVAMFCPVVIGKVKVEAKAIAVEHQGAVQVRDLEDDGNEAAGTLHTVTMPCREVFVITDSRHRGSLPVPRPPIARCRASR